MTVVLRLGCEIHGKHYYLQYITQFYFCLDLVYFQRDLVQNPKVRCKGGKLKEKGRGKKSNENFVVAMNDRESIRHETSGCFFSSLSFHNCFNS